MNTIRTTIEYVVQRYDVRIGVWADCRTDLTEEEATRRLALLEVAAEPYRIIARTTVRTDDVVVGPIPAETPLPGTRVRIVNMDYPTTYDLTGTIVRYDASSGVPHRVVIDGESMTRCYFTDDIEIADDDERRPMTRERLVANNASFMELAQFDIINAPAVEMEHRSVAELRRRPGAFDVVS